MSLNSQFRFIQWSKHRYLFLRKSYSRNSNTAVSHSFDWSKSPVRTFTGSSSCNNIPKNETDKNQVLLYPLDTCIELKRVPTLPFIGSLWESYSQAPPYDLDYEREWLLTMRKTYGDFYSYGIPGFGEGLHGTIYFVSDPREFVNLMRHEGIYPSGAVENLWPSKRAFTDRKRSIVGLFGRGQDWKNIRTFLQTHLLSPQSATGYVPGVIMAAELASKAAPKCSHTLNSYLHRCSFDMFCTVLFGELTNVANPDVPSDPVNKQFIEAAVTFVQMNMALVMDPVEGVLAGMLNIRTRKYKIFDDSIDVILHIVEQKVQAFEEKYKSNKLNDLEKQSYVAHAIKRRDEMMIDQNKTLSNEQLVETITALLAASVDTTSGLLAWALLHAALNPEIQEKIHEELISNIGGRRRLTFDAICTRSTTPYLYAFLRECHRLTPAVTTSIMKQVSNPVEIHGTVLPANSKIMFNNYAIQMDPMYVNNPEEFQPQRWLPEAIEKRKNTPKQIIDHPYFKDPFSQGARKCPGSRVSFNEVLCLFSQLILDYQIKAPSELVRYNDVKYATLGVSTPFLPQFEFIPRSDGENK